MLYHFVNLLIIIVLSYNFFNCSVQHTLLLLVSRLIILGLCKLTVAVSYVQIKKIK